MKLKARTAIITGANQGLGEAIAVEFVRQGADVFICARDKEKLSAVKEKLEKIAAAGQKIRSMAADVSRESDVKGLIGAAIAEFGQVDIFVNNAGVYGPKGAIEQVNSTDWVRAIEINLNGVFYCCKHIVAHMKKNGYGKIINLSGGGATAPLPFISAYAASKAGVVRLTETLAVECQGSHIDINAVAPGALNTRLLDEVLSAGPEVVGSDFYNKSLKQKKDGGVPLEVGVELCVFLASSDSDGITGRIISAKWDPWKSLPARRKELMESDIYTLRRITPEDRGENMGPIMNVGIVGCGLIGKKRALALGGHHLLWAIDPDIKRAQAIAGLGPQAGVSADVNETIKDPRVDVVVVATPNDKLAAISLAAIKAGKHVLVEKPAARNFRELEEVMRLSQEKKVMVKVGFNLRYHPALMKAREIVDSGVMGDLMFLRGRYGHGGRLGYEKEWRAKPEISGGGELIDQGVHMIDLCRWFLGDLVSVEGKAATYFWDMPVDDNAFLCLSTQKNQTAWIHVSCTEWKNMFSLEIYGKIGKIQIDGLGGSYGMEKLTYYQMLPQMGPPQTTVYEYPGEDRSWHLEFEAFAGAVSAGGPLNGDVHDAYEALKIVDKIYNP